MSNETNTAAAPAKRQHDVELIMGWCADLTRPDAKVSPVFSVGLSDNGTFNIRQLRKTPKSMREDRHARSLAYAQREVTAVLVDLFALAPAGKPLRAERVAHYLAKIYRHNLHVIQPAPELQ